MCVALNLTQCECSNVTQACHVCCVLNGTCTSTIQIANDNIMGLRDQLPGQMGRNIQVGRPCANFTGYCDFLNSCMLANEDGALFRLANLLFNSAAFRRFLDFIRTMWWVLVIAGVGLLVILFFVVLFFHCVLPRPKHVKSREERRSIRRRHRNQQHDGGYNTQQDFPPGHYPQNYHQYK